MSDPRKPKLYYVTEEEYLNQKTSLQKLKSKLDDLTLTRRKRTHHLLQRRLLITRKTKQQGLDT